MLMSEKLKQGNLCIDRERIAAVWGITVVCRDGSKSIRREKLG